MRTHNKDTQATITPDKALTYLKEGNGRFVRNLKTNRNLLEQVNETRDGQWPFATILSCIDSRTSAELVFDQGLGDIFSIRLAGNVLSDGVLGSMEFACKVAGSRLLVVLGHLTTLLNLIQPSVYFERTVTENRTSTNPEFVDRVAQIQVRRAVEGVIERSMVLREMIEKREIGLVGAIYDVATRAVQFFDDTWMCGEVRH